MSDGQGPGEQLLGQLEPLNMVGVRMRDDQVFALGKRKIELADQFDNFSGRIFISDVDQQPLIAVEHQVHAASEPAPGLVIHFNDMRK